METKQTLIIVESPSKARTLRRVLGKEYQIEASVGHFRDLPKKSMGVDPDNNFKVTYELDPGKKKVLSDIRKALKNAEVVYLATDPDREGEAISWHLIEILDIKVPVHRLVFHEVTKSAIIHAFEETRSIDQRLVSAQETRRILDRLVGYSISPILWRKMTPGLSAGRVQSVATRLVVDRERQRKKFTSHQWWDLIARFSKQDGGAFNANLIRLDGNRLINGKDFDRQTGELKSKSGTVQLNENSALALKASLQTADWSVSKIVAKPGKSQPSPPFTTSTLQQTASSRLRFTPRRTMQAAQKLYENGHITYMRTDSTTLSQEALQAARTMIKVEYGAAYLPDKPRFYKTKVKNAQEAHEAIRPAGSSFRRPGELTDLDQDQRALYELIYRRTLACQMPSAVIVKTTAEIIGGPAVFQAEGKVVEFPGFLVAYGAYVKDNGDQDKNLPPLAEGESLNIDTLEPKAHDTKPPARFTEATLIKEMESLGIGRPSTYASIMDTIQRREYVVRHKGALVPTFVAIGVVRLMEQYFSELVDYQFTARMEDILDEISRGERESVPYLSKFYFGAEGIIGLKDQLEADIDIRSICTINLGEGADTAPVNVRIGRYGPYLEHGERRANIDADIAPDQIDLKKALELIELSEEFPKHLGDDPETGQPVYLKKGRFGLYFQLGDDDAKLKQKSLLPGMHQEDASLAFGLDLLALPKEIGTHPDTGEPVFKDLGRYGPYLKSGSKNKSLPHGEDLLSITLDRAVELLNSKKTTGTEIIKVLGNHPRTEADILIKTGRYGPYITDGSVNVSLRKSDDPETIELDDAITRLADKAAKGPTKRRRVTKGAKAKPKAKAKKK
jgi:DNA topoisomerase-1